MMKAYFMTTAFVISCLAIVSHTFPVGDNKAKAALYLQNYLGSSSDSRTAAISGADAISNALKDFQRFLGLNQTDNDTVLMLNKTRCGVKDKIGHSGSKRKKRYALQGSRWQVKKLTYRITKYPTRLKDRKKVAKEIARAFKIWSDVTPLTFEERRRGRVNIAVSFETGDHGDFEHFGPGGTLAHAFFPQSGGDVHFDDAEKWSIDDRTDAVGPNLFFIAAHEIGHSLGLLHSDKAGALMEEYDNGYQPGFRLHSDDIAAIQSLYGSRDKPVPDDDENGPLGPPPDTSDSDDLCQDATIDTVTRIQDGSTYVFKGEFYWKILSNGIANGYPRKISDDWDGLEGNLDASVTWADGKTFFFKGGHYWRFTNKEMDSGYPKFLEQGFEGIGDMVDAAFVWSGNGKTYFFKGDEFWKYESNNDPPVSRKYPKLVSNWIGLPADGVDAAFQWENNRTYFFKGDKYYKFNDENFEVDAGDPPYPRSTAKWWFNCKASSLRADPSGHKTNSTEASLDNDIY